MIKIAFAGVWVHDQDEALAFYTEKLGWELRADVTLPEFGNYRWLTVGPPAQPDVSVLLNAIPGPPIVDETTADQIRGVMAKGWGGNVLLTTDDIHRDFEELSARGIEFTESPEERPYGIDSAFRDPSGNQFRLTQVREGVAV
jgi:catechol 2,3-dioxygenase-like lactoylglutathione lyase family enzyme